MDRDTGSSWSFWPWPRLARPVVQSKRTGDCSLPQVTVFVPADSDEAPSAPGGGHAMWATEAWNFSSPQIATLGVPPLPVRVKSFPFSPPLSDRALDNLPGVEPSLKTDPSPVARQIPAENRRSRTHFRPPRDVIQLHERLLYVLQPPLETLFHSGGLPLTSEPFPYQWEGIAFLATRHAAILADEMGLGKTMQAITAIRLLLNQQEVRSVLLVCPKALVSNWQREFARWGPEVPVAAVEGVAARRQWQWQQDDFPVKIVTYESLVRDAPILDASGQRFDLVLLDEAQRIKNRESLTSRVAHNIERCRSWALTGTPVENSVRDFVGICDFVAPGAVHEDLDAAALGYAARDLLLRRTKEQVLPQLPPRISCDAVLDLTDEQKRTYQIAENEGVLRLSDLGDSATIQHVLELVTRLKQICNVDPATGSSCKLERLRADLEEVLESGRKVLIFSQWVNTLTWLAEELDAIRPLQYHGQVPRSSREQIIDRFQRDPQRNVLLMSYGCGGVGLNLQCAEYVFLFDRWWNPAVEEQAVNRAHRIGSVGAVTITRFVTRQTIEERIDEILRHKRALFDSVMGNATGTAKAVWNRDAIFGLFRGGSARTA